jgi:transcriptional regulatory protein RtcR
LSTLAPGGRITREVLDAEIGRLRKAWRATPALHADDALLIEVLGPEGAERLDLFDRAQLACVIRTARESRTLSDAGRRLFSVSRANRKITNDADRLRKYLARFGVSWEACLRKSSAG